ncbi:M23 family metallopeptidase [Cohnella panacarvi]|uniref:M23 family metallopeptidase n=1 Tax=Cohnella panacarvi TaxID=400776 RepID=UPI0004787C0D|nr:M23 family metallopeptidase [Cohnella panacarvi]
MKWSRKRFTFMVIPDANSSVIRFQLSAVVLITGVVLFVAILASAITAFLLYRGNHSQIGHLQNRISASTGQYEQIIQDKDVHINELQTEIVGLSEQAKSIDNHMSDLKELESQLKQMAGIEDGGDTKAAAKLDGLEIDSDFVETEIEMEGGTGGEELPVTDAEMNALIGETRDFYSDLAQRAETLRPELEQTKADVLKMAAILRVTPTIWPTDSRKLTSPFGVRKDPFTKRAKFHAGLDIGGDYGDSIYATADGTVLSAERTSSHGLNIWISHSNGVRTHYSHLSKMLVGPGDKVKKGDLIAKMGSTGRSTGPHLHYEVAVNGTNVDPKPYLKATRREN